MPWRPLPRIAFAVAVYPFQPSSPADLPLELGDELYIIEQGGKDGAWYRGYLVAPPSLLAGLTSVKGQTLEARVFSGIFPKNCVEVREVLEEADKSKENGTNSAELVHVNGTLKPMADGGKTNSANGLGDLKSSRKTSQITVIRLEEDPKKRRSGSPLQSPSMALTPRSTSSRDPLAPRPPAPVPMLKIGDETPTSLSEPLVDEIASCLREWHSTNIHELLLARQYTALEDMSNIVLELDLARRQLLHNVLTAQERASLREATVWNLVRGNKTLNGDVIVRDPKQRGRLLTGEDSAIDVAKLQSEMSMLDGETKPNVDAVSLHHLLLEVNAVTGTKAGSVSLAISLWLQNAKGDMKQLTESYALEIPSAETFATMAQNGTLKTLFTELNAADIGDNSASGSKIYLVIKVFNPESARPSFTSSSRASSRDGTPATKAAPALNNASKGSLKSRRSMMWGPKPKGLSHLDQNEIARSSQPSEAAGNGSGNPEKPVKEVPVSRLAGIGVLEIGSILKADKDVDHVINIWSPLGLTDEEDNYAEGFDNVIRSLLPSPTSRYGRCYRASRLHIHLYAFASDDTESLIRNNPTLLHKVAQTRRIGFPAAPTKPRSDIYVNLSKVNISQDALLSHPINGQVAVPQITGLRNLQLTIEARNASGARIEHCIYPSSNSSGLTAWRTTVAERGSGWNQVIRLNIPSDQVQGSHLIMSVADAPEFPFALSWMPLWDQQAFMRDGRHSLLLHAYDKHTSSVENGKGSYLSLPWSALGKNESTKDEAVTGPLATLALETELCSTEYSQDQVLLGLVNWKEKPATQLLELLRRIVFVPEIEIVKQLRDVFDALFGIMVEQAGNEEFEDLIFSDLVTVLGIVHDRRFNLGPLVDKYAEYQFNFPFATPCLLRSLLRLLQATTDPQQARNLRAAFKVGRHLLKFIINARGQQKAKEECIGITNIQSTFNRDLHSIFESVESLMQNPAPNLVGSKTLAVQHFHTWLPELLNALNKDEVIKIAFSFMDACKDVKNMLVLYKLVLILNYTRLPLFAGEDKRKLLVSKSIQWLAPYWGETPEVTDQYRDQVRLCSSVVAEQLQNPGPELFEYMPKAVASYCAIVADGVDETEWLSLLFSKAFPFQLKQSKTKQKFDEALVELSAIIAAMSKLPKQKELSLSQDELAVFLSHTFHAHKSVLSCEAYPATWLSLHIYHHQSIMKSLEDLSSILIKSFLPTPDEADTFDMELWRLFFTTLLKLVSSDALALETFPEQRRRAVWKIAGDVREHGAELLQKTWRSIGWDTTIEERARYGLIKLGGYQVQYVPGLVPPIIELCLSVHEGPRRVAVEILQTMIVSEWQLNEDLSMIEAEIISSLDELFKTKHLTESITQKLFINELLGLFETSSSTPDAELMVTLKELIATVDELLDLLVASHNGNITESLNTIKLMEFMKDMEREDIFIRYVHELAHGQAGARNYTEAGLALQFHADLYDWDTSKTVPALANPFFPEQTAFERKEALYFEIIQHFEDGKAWAHALSCYRELADHYEHTIIDFSKLSRTQASMARIYEAIVKEDILISRYFRVTFKGLGFPPTLRDKQYIFEGSPSDRMVTFTDRMQKQYPAAQIVHSNEIEDLEGQFLQISPVSVHKDMNHPVYQRPKVPQSVREHLLTAMTSNFSVTSKKHMGGNQVKEQYVTKAVFTTAEPFPNVLRRSEIVETEEVVLTPLQTAVERTSRKTQELLILEKRISSGDDTSLTSLTEILGHMLDIQSSAPTCVAQYREFLVDEPKIHLEYDTEDFESVPPVDPLKNALAVALVDHALAMKRCIALYSQPTYEATHNELTQRLEAAFAPELATLATSPSQQSQPDSSSHFNPRIDPFTSGSISGSPSSQPRLPSPKLELGRPSHDSTAKPTDKPPASNRLSLNLFKRSNHAPSSSNATITAINAVITPQKDQNRHDTTHITGISSDRRIKTPKSASVKSDHGREPESFNRDRSHSRGGKSDTSRKRRSFFSTNEKSAVGAIEVHRNAASVPPASPPTEDMRTTQQRIMERANKSRAQQNQQDAGRCNSTPNNAVQRGGQQNGSGDSCPRTSDKGTGRPKTAHSSNSEHGISSGGVRDSVMKRFSLLKVGRKASKANFRDGNLGGILKEE
ncbi:SH3 domain containing protein [Coccidioides posadasii C735 delta SOWgp]|uniref:SH3 domain containing protein n=1 Tax=Coccidioides posadasii (strain C735) TaxID=222929 RepID=C5P0L8_COCP7|nr:SH3 domain containing protein [Coccidioides posadasii C735 delta SOWgp]EER29226.1 SH3 domain containing protein [Coccidioides posadasii C735 delta SOWgp]|eukprot:XP_003071371.1 SH3 domain containing protein [Coccidioides posadasii C735 delta SOWgp]